MKPRAILTSLRALVDEEQKQTRPGIAKAIGALRGLNSTVFCVSNRDEPAWFAPTLPGVKFQAYSGRKNGKEVVGALIKANARLGLDLSNFVVLTASDDDMIMGANARALAFRADWVPGNGRWKNYGIPVTTPDELARLIALLNTSSPWYFESDVAGCATFALANGGNWNQPKECQHLADQLREYLKEGTSLLRGVQLHLLSSIYLTPSLRDADVWGYYPSSTPKDDDMELMALVARLVREPLKRMYAQQGRPLLVRHRPAQARHIRSVDRMNPCEQIESVHVNPDAERCIRGKNVVVLDDYLSYGVSFSVARSLLEAAGAKSVAGVAMGKFGNAGHIFEIEVKGNPCKPLKKGDYRVASAMQMSGTYVQQAQLELLSKFGETLS